MDHRHSFIQSYLDHPVVDESVGAARAVAHHSQLSHAVNDRSIPPAFEVVDEAQRILVLSNTSVFVWSGVVVLVEAVERGPADIGLTYPSRHPHYSSTASGADLRSLKKLCAILSIPQVWRQDRAPRIDLVAVVPSRVDDVLRLASVDAIPADLAFQFRPTLDDQGTVAMCLDVEVDYVVAPHVVDACFRQPNRWLVPPASDEVGDVEDSIAADGAQLPLQFRGCQKALDAD